MCIVFLIEFKISAAIRHHSGNSPLEITSSITFYELRMVIGKKLDRFPELLRLSYRLNIDKAKDDATTIHTEEELKIFKNRMRPLVVPQRLSNGKISTRTLRQVIVFFEDSSDTASLSTGGSVGSRGGKSTNSKGSGKKFSTDDSASNVPENHAQTAIKNTIADLQKHWKCAIHSKEKDKYCWKFEGICRELSFNNLGFWAVEIVGFDINEAIHIYTNSQLARFVDSTCRTKVGPRLIQNRKSSIFMTLDCVTALQVSNLQMFKAVQARNITALAHSIGPHTQCHHWLQFPTPPDRPGPAYSSTVSPVIYVAHHDIASPRKTPLLSQYHHLVPTS